MTAPEPVKRIHAQVVEHIDECHQYLRPDSLAIQAMQTGYRHVKRMLEREYPDLKEQHG